MERESTPAIVPANAPTIAIVVPCYNEEAALPGSALQLSALIRQMVDAGQVSEKSFILYVDDGSRDATWSIIENLTLTSVHNSGLKMAGNVGHQNALLAGLEAVKDRAEAAITIDADLQDDIRVIPQMVVQFCEGSDIVYGVRDNRDSDTWFKRTTAIGFYKFMNFLGVKTVYNHSDFRLMSCRAIDALLRYEERNIYLRGIVPQLGYKQSKVYYARLPRMAGETKYPFSKMMNLALDGITSFSVRPIRILFSVGMIFIFVALCMLIYVLYNKFTGNTTEGWSSLILSIWFCSGVLLLSMAVVGEYVGKIYTETKHRPRYNVERKVGDPFPKG